MKIIETVEQIRQYITHQKRQNKTIGFVPTMGNLHEGHLNLVKTAKAKADIVAVSIFVNPMQFGVNEDLASYPRTLPADTRELEALGVDILFMPTPDIIYPKGLEQQTFVEVPNVSALFCGHSRPVHFRGVTTVVNKLFNLVQPDFACFGEKDFQQLSLIKLMVEDLSLPIHILAVPTAREPSGLAKSSRNGYLSETEKQQATVLFEALQYAAQQIEIDNQFKISHQAEIDNPLFLSIKNEIQQRIHQAGLTPDYVEIVDAHNLQTISQSTTQVVVLLAAYIGKTRLIDNKVVNLQSS